MYIRTIIIKVTKKNTNSGSNEPPRPPTSLRDGDRPDVSDIGDTVRIEND